MLRYIIIFAVLIGLLSCNDNEGQTISLSEVRYYDKFPNEVTLNEISDFKINEIGLSSIKVLDDYIIFSHGSKNWSIYSKGELKKLNEILSVGQGPNEFLFVPSASGSLFLTGKDDSIYCYMRDEMKHRVVELNLTKAIEGDVTLKPALVNEIMSSMTWDVTPLGPKEVLLHIPFDDFRGFKRIYLSEDTLFEVPSTLKLSEAKVNDESQINYLVKSARYNQSNKKVIEAMRRFNQINIYSIDKNWGVTVCMGDKLDKIESVTSPICWMADSRHINLVPCGTTPLARYIPEIMSEIL